MKKAFQFLVLLVVPVILFHSAIEAGLDKFLLKYLFKGFESSYLKDACILTVAALTGYYYLTRPKRYISSRFRSCFVLFAAAVYLVYRFFWQHWLFFPFRSAPWLFYADLMLVVAMGELFLLVKSFLGQSEAHAAAPAFYGNKPISTGTEDLLGYPDYAAVIAEKLNQSQFEEAFAIGINGKWGSGKTSFLNLVREKISRERRIIIDFKPWNAHDPQAILKDFFETVQMAISPYHATLAGEIREYGKKLVELHNNSLSQSLAATFDLLTGYNDSLSNQYEQINQGLKKIDHQLIICIDDLDRLDTREINEVIRLIRNTANFYNTVFLAAYDREYLLSAIKQLNEYNYQHFLEKIFQLEINLPGFSTSVLKNYLNDGIIRVFGPGHEAECRAAVDELYTYKVNVLQEWIASIRDINHILNSLTVNAVQIKEEVLITDMLKLELLRYRFPLVYTDLFYRSEHWLDAERAATYGGEPVYELRKGYPQQLIVANDLMDEKGPYQLRKEDAGKIVDLLQMLFKQNYYHGGQEYLSVKYPLNFSKYFQYSLKKSQFSNKEFFEARGSDLAVFKKKIEEWLSDNYAAQLHRLFKRLDDFTGQEDYEKIIRAIIFMSNTRLLKEHYSPFSFYPFKLETFADRLHDYELKISKKIYKEKDGKSGKFKAFARSLFGEAEFPYYYEGQVLNFYKTADNIRKSPLTLREIDAYLMRYFEDYLEKSDSFSWDDWHFFDFLKKGGKGAATGELAADTHSEKAIALFKSHIARHLDEFILSVIHSEWREKKGTYSVSKHMFQLFPEAAELSDFLTENQAGFFYVEEFLLLVEAYEKNGRLPVTFDFRVIPVRKAEEED